MSVLENNPENERIFLPVEKPHEECGVFGVYSENESFDAAALTYLGLYALQHRGQESAGIAVSDGRRLRLSKGMGLVRQIFKDEDLRRLPGPLAIGHVRYSTTGGTSLINAQPIVARCSYGQIALSHNGNILNSEILLNELIHDGSVLQSSSDTEIILNVMAQYSQLPLEEALREACSRLQGSYSLLILTRDSLMALRDPYGNRPLCLGQLNGAYIFASETCALVSIGAKLIKHVAPGELIRIDRDGVHSRILLTAPCQALCSMEFIYFARPDSVIDGCTVHTVRKEMGKELARMDPIDADVVIPVPDTALSAALGFAEESKIPLDMGLVVNRYVGRTFIQPTQEMRDRGVLIKLSPIESVLTGKRVVIVDDSIVRGTTSGIRINVLREAGAKEVHMYVSAPPYRYPCYYGIDVSSKKELIAATKTIEQVRKAINADSLHYLSFKSLHKATGLPRNKLCTACFSGNYPMTMPDNHCGDKFRLENTV
ncbi:MAG: amidophosphoribosyltransferase [Bacillota bacterium]